jgi:hypothetical protein
MVKKSDSGNDPTHRIPEETTVWKG